jgi:hypothetical protein
MIAKMHAGLSDLQGRMEPFFQLIAHLRQVPRKEVVCITNEDKLLGLRRSFNQFL